MGLILVGCCPGGTVSNVVTLIARADVALSVMMATLSTLAAVLLIPPLTGLLAGRYVPVDGWKLLLDVLLAALLLHGGGFFLGWLIPALLGQPQPVSRTASIEVGLQNSGQAVVRAALGVCWGVGGGVLNLHDWCAGPSHGGHPTRVVPRLTYGYFLTDQAGLARKLEIGA